MGGDGIGVCVAGGGGLTDSYGGQEVVIISSFCFTLVFFFCFVMSSLFFLSEWSIIAVLSVSVYYLFSLSPVPLTRS